MLKMSLSLGWPLNQNAKLVNDLCTITHWRECPLSQLVQMDFVTYAGLI